MNSKGNSDYEKWFSVLTQEYPRACVYLNLRRFEGRQTGTSVVPVRDRRSSPVKVGPDSKVRPGLWNCRGTWCDLTGICLKESDQAGVDKGMH